MQIFLSAFDDVPDPRASNARHDLGELLVIAFFSIRKQLGLGSSLMFAQYSQHPQYYGRRPMVEANSK
jgi:hypothetical protein